MLDEATAAVDLQTDMLIQQAIKENFANLTVMTIAHRLNTVMESDKIMVMDAGKVVEFDKPLKLLEKLDGHFTSLLRETGQESFDKLKKVAEDKAKRDLELKSGHVSPSSDGIASDPSIEMKYGVVNPIYEPEDEVKVDSLNESKL